MRRDRLRIPVLAALVLALSIATTTQSASTSRPMELAVRPAAGGTHQLVAPVRGRASGVALRETALQIRASRLLEIGQENTLLARWQEGPADHAVEYGSVSLNGGASWSEARPISFDLHLRAGTFDPLRASLSAPFPSLAARSDGRVFVIQLDSVSLAPLRARLRALGVELLAPLPEHAWIARMEAPVVARVQALPWVRWVGRYEPWYRAMPELLGELAAGAPAEAARRYRIQSYTPGLGERSELAREVTALGGEIVLNVPNGYVLEANLTPPQALELLHSNHVQWLELWTEIGYDMDIVREQCGANYVESVGGYNGSGVTGEVMDGGVMATHQDFDGIQIHDGASPVGDHGTCTYGIVFGNGNRDGDGDAVATGLLPGATGWFADSNFTDRYQITEELNQPPIEALFQSNSWGSAQVTTYTSVSFEMDDIIWQSDVPIFQSQSNTGDQRSRPQAWAKNIISVGAVRHYNTLALTDDCWCDGASIGPAEDGRLKPDLAHWYDAIYTTDNEPGGYNAGLYYPDFGGTSAATPIVAGISGLFLEMWADNVLGNNPAGTTAFEKRPHATTTKALMINTAEQYPFTGLNHDLTRTHQGWGLPSARNLYDRANLIKVIDESEPLRDLDRHLYTARVPAGQGELKVTMVYPDRAGTTAATLHRINDVDLVVTDPTGNPWLGNVGLDAGVWSQPGGTADDRNTVENVFIQNPMTGDWKVEVIAREINQEVHRETPADDQDYALVVYGADSLVDCRDSVAAPTSVTANPSAPNEITVTWSGAASQYEVWRSLGGCSASPDPPTLVNGTTFVDTTVSGNVPYGYIVRAVGADCVSRDSVCVEATTTGDCLLPPSFDGLANAQTTGLATCGIALDWSAGTDVCGGPLVYNVYRSTDPAFTPGPSNRVAACVSLTTRLDTRQLIAGQEYYYIVRAEDLAATGPGSCGGLEETNLVRVAASPAEIVPLVRYGFDSGFDGWTATAGNPAASTGLWVAGDPVGTINNGNAAQPDAPAVGAGCLYTGENPNGDPGTDDIDGGEVIATSPIFDGRGSLGSRLDLLGWFYNRDLGADAGDYFIIDVSANGGGSWTPVVTLDNNVRANFWSGMTADLEKFVTPSANMQVRVRAADGPNLGNIVEAAIDEAAISLRNTCTTAAATVGVIQGVPGPLLAAKLSGDRIHLEWQPDCGGSTTYGIYEGDLSAGPLSFRPVTGMCDVAALSADLPFGAPAGEFFLVAPNRGGEEGSLGIVGPGMRRPQGAASCYPRSGNIDSCAP